MLVTQSIISKCLVPFAFRRTVVKKAIIQRPIFNVTLVQTKPLNLRKCVDLKIQQTRWYSKPINVAPAFPKSIQILRCVRFLNDFIDATHQELPKKYFRDLQRSLERNLFAQGYRWKVVDNVMELIKEGSSQKISMPLIKIEAVGSTFFKQLPREARKQFIKDLMASQKVIPSGGDFSGLSFALKKAKTETIAAHIQARRS